MKCVLFFFFKSARLEVLQCLSLLLRLNACGSER